MGASSHPGLTIPKGVPHWIALREKRAKLRRFESGNKTKVRRRDHYRCRWPKCSCHQAIRRGDPVTIEVAHLDDKGMGGDHGQRSTAVQMICLCKMRHQGPTDSLHSQDCRIEPLTERGTSGPCEFYLRIGANRWRLVGREIAVGILETSRAPERERLLRAGRPRRRESQPRRHSAASGTCDSVTAPTLPPTSKKQADTGGQP